MHNLIGIIASFAFVFAILGVATILMQRGVLSPGMSRKLVHIGVSNWWLLAMALMDSLPAAAVGPVVFIVINSLSYRRLLFPAMDAGAPRENLGTVYFPISLLAVVLLCYGGPFPLHAGALAVLIMGYGDGAAALVGSRRGKRGLRLFRYQADKSLAGSSTMLLVAFVVAVPILAVARPELGALGIAATAAAVALFASLVELFSPRGIDNLTVPIATLLFYGGLLI
jgi:phytol kinase